MNFTNNPIKKDKREATKTRKKPTTRIYNIMNKNETKGLTLSQSKLGLIFLITLSKISEKKLSRILNILID